MDPMNAWNLRATYFETGYISLMNYLQPKHDTSDPHNNMKSLKIFFLSNSEAFFLSVHTLMSENFVFLKISGSV